MLEKIMAPCIPQGTVRSVWQTDSEGGLPGMYALSDDDSKEAECRCQFGACCVDSRNHVVQGIVLTAGGVKNLSG